MLHHQAMSSTFEFLHNYCHKSLSGVYKGRGVFMLKGSAPLCCGFLHFFLVLVFGIINFLSRVYQGLKKSVKLCAFGLHHKANTSSCDDFL
jgi:hypothetical protein